MDETLILHDGLEVVYRQSPEVTAWELTELYAVAWKGYPALDFRRALDHSLLFMCAYHGERLVGFVRLAWDGLLHAFLLDPTVHPDFQRRGIGRELVRLAVSGAKYRGVEWVHVDYEPHLRNFYEQCGFRSTEAGLIRLN